MEFGSEAKKRLHSFPPQSQATSFRGPSSLVMRNSADAVQLIKHVVNGVKPCCYDPFGQVASFTSIGDLSELP